MNVELSPNKIKNWLKQKIATISNRLQSTKKIDKIADKHQLIGWTIGHYLDGRYKAKNRNVNVLKSNDRMKQEIKIINFLRFLYTV